MNYWFWLLFLIPPILVFAVQPQAGVWRRIGRLLLASGLGYIFLNLAVHHSIDSRRKAHEFCLFANSGHSGPYESSLYDKLLAICPPAPNSGPPEAFYLLFGWMPAASYTGLWELVWRIRYRTDIRNLGKAFKARWLSTIWIIFSIPGWPIAVIVVVVWLLLAVDRWIDAAG
jgi:hypothetical protein